MIMLGQPNRGAGDRLGVIASRRLGDAVFRNRAKRRLREVFRRGRSVETVSRSFDLVVIPRRELVTANFSTIETDFWAAVRRMRGER
jgi:ribonuclease P protein component